MKRTVLILLCVAMLLSLAACGQTEPEAPSVRVDYEYPQDYMSAEIYPMENILRDTEKYYRAISKAYPDRPVLVLITHKMLSGFSVENNDALNQWLEENGFGFSLMVYGMPFRREEIISGLTFSEKLKQYVDAGGRCDLILPDPNWSALSGHGDDNVWDYVNSGLVTAIDDIASKADIEALSRVYGEVYLESNRDGGKLYGLSPSALEGAKLQTYVAVAPEVLPLVSEMSKEELARAIVFDGEFLSRAVSVAQTSVAVGQFSTSIYELVGPFITGERYVPLGNLQLYADSESFTPEVLGLWEIPGYDELLKAFTENRRNGLWSNNVPLSDSAAAMYFFSAHGGDEMAQKQIDFLLSRSGVSRKYTALPLPGYPVNVSMENALMISASSADPALSCEAAIAAYTDPGFARVLASGVEGKSYTEEKGQYTALKDPFGVCVLNNPFFTVQTQPHLAGYDRVCIEMQKTAGLTPYENYTPDLTGLEAEIDALARWSCDLNVYLSVGDSDITELSSGEKANLFPTLPPPDISGLKQRILSDAW